MCCQILKSTNCVVYLYKGTTCIIVYLFRKCFDYEDSDAAFIKLIYENVSVVIDSFYSKKCQSF
jgi:hypothetical protein